MHEPEKPPEDYRLLISIKNGRLWQALQVAYPGKNVAACARRMRVSYATLLNLLAIRLSPVLKRSHEWRPVVLKISKRLRVLPEDLFDLVLYGEPMPVVEIPVSRPALVALSGASRLLALPGGVEEESAEAQVTRQERVARLEQALKLLTPRQATVLRLRFGLDDGQERSYTEIGEMFAVTKSRVAQIEAKALQKLRHPARGLSRVVWSAKGYRTWVEALDKD